MKGLYTGLRGTMLAISLEVREKGWTDLTEEKKVALQIARGYDAILAPLNTRGGSAGRLRRRKKGKRKGAGW
jgi:hypothetical protein